MNKILTLVYYHKQDEQNTCWNQRPRPSQPEKAQIAVDGADYRYQDLRIENTLTNEHGGDVRLKKGAHVEVTVTAEDSQPTRRR